MLLPFLDPFSRTEIDAEAPEHTAANQHGKQLDQRAQGRGLSQAQGNQKADGKQNGCTQQPQKESVLPRASGTEKSCRRCKDTAQQQTDSLCCPNRDPSGRHRQRQQPHQHHSQRYCGQAANRCRPHLEISALAGFLRWTAASCHGLFFHKNHPVFCQ